MLLKKEICLINLKKIIEKEIINVNTVVLIKAYIFFRDKFLFKI